MNPAIAIVGMACRYPDAASPSELWENALAQRRAFRQMPVERLNPADYYSPDPHAPDRTYSTIAALIEDYVFDRVRFRISGRVYRSADLAHWLALDIAGRALEDAGFAEGQGLPQEGTAVYLGNTLTGEFSRAATMRLRWPYVRRVVGAVLSAHGHAPQERAALLNDIESEYKRPFAEVNEETLAGGLSNTIAGRISNHFDLKGGSYTVDGACASSLLAVSTACSALAAGDCDAALAGGVDLSLDPFELVGFAKAGALAPERMRVYDVRSAGFWPGEGCGFAVLMRLEDALASGRSVYALIRGWGISSDGSGGITRPEVDGQLLALGRAYKRAGFGPDSVAYFEGHGTGTAVGDATELRVLARARREAGASAAAAISTIKANIGHTKAAAGIAGLIKAAMAVHAQVLPPATGCESPHPEMAPLLRALGRPEPWPEELPVRAAVSAMGFGGINSHVILEGAAAARRSALSAHEARFARTPQDAELFLFQSPQQVARAAELAAGLSLSEMTDLAAALARENVAGENAAGASRAAIVASTPEELTRKLAAGVKWREPKPGGPRIGFLFPGQGSQNSAAATDIAQPAIVRDSLAALRELSALGIEASTAIGHSLGELTALCWAGVLTEDAVTRIAAARGRFMADIGGPPGAMAGIAAGEEEVLRLVDGEPAVIAGLNSPRQTVISGEAEAVKRVAARAGADGYHAVLLPVSHAFHSPLVAPAAEPLSACLAQEEFRSPQRLVISTVTGEAIHMLGLRATAIFAGEEFPTPQRPGISIVGGKEIQTQQRPRMPAVTGEELQIPRLRATTTVDGEEFQRPQRSVISTGGREEIHTPHPVISAVTHEQLHLPRLLATTTAASEEFHTPQRPLISAVGGASGPGDSPAQLLVRQITSPVLFRRALESAGDIDLWIEVGPGRVLSAIAAESVSTPVVSVESGSGSRRAFLEAVAAAWEAGAPVRPAALFDDRFTRPFRGRRKFFVNPCELAPSDESGEPAPVVERPAEPAAQSAASPLEVVRALIAERADLPASVLRDDARLLGDLHLNSIVVAQIATDAARRLDLAPPPAPLDYAGLTIGEIASTLEAARSAPPGEEPGVPAGVDAWVRPFEPRLLPRPLPAAAKARGAAGEWRFFGPPEGTLRAALEQSAPAGSGVILCLPPEANERLASTLLEAAKAAARLRPPARFVLVQHGGGAAALARTICLEARVPVCVVDVPAADPRGVERVLAEVAAVRTTYCEAHYDVAGGRYEPVLSAVSPELQPFPLDASDVLLVSGGGRGIGAECAIESARLSGAKLVILGTTAAGAHPELDANLKRMQALGLRFEYRRADVTDPAAVRAVFERVGPVTAILHCAGINSPCSIEALEEPDFRRTAAVKVTGLRNLLEAADALKLRLLVSFGSIIARMGLPGQAGYAVANEWLEREMVKWSVAHPHCRCRTLEFSVWSGTGMGQRVARLESLIRAGISPISIDEGVRAFADALRYGPEAPATLVIAGRFGAPPTVRFDAPELPLLRFLERVRVHYPAVELVAEADLSPANDPYLDDHVFSQARLLPAVMALEAMAQTAMALAGSARPPVFEQVRLARPVIVGDESATVIRLAALARGERTVEVCLRSSETGFQTDHVQAVCRFDDPVREVSIGAVREPQPVMVDPARDLYGSLLFQANRFRRLRAYRHLSATECMAEAEGSTSGDWFSHYLPETLVLGDPGVRDAALHAIQACIPHKRVLPTGARRIAILPHAARPWYRIRAVEQSRKGSLLVYDLEIATPDGEVVERWDGLELRIVSAADLPDRWPPGLLAPYLERRLGEIGLPGGVSVEFNEMSRSNGFAHRPDGKPLLNGSHISRAHAGDFTFTVTAPLPVGCDCEAVVAKPAETWRDLLSADGLALAEMVVRENNESLDSAATRVWCALESAKKAGARRNLGIVLDRAVEPNGWVILRAGSARIATLVAAVTGSREPLAFAILVDS